MKKSDKVRNQKRYTNKLRNKNKKNVAKVRSQKINVHTEPTQALSGKVIGSGTYGCVFKPPIKCSSNSNSNSKGNSKYKKISKLMLLEEAESEYYKHQKIKKILKKIKNSKDYFLFSDSLCLPNDLPSKLSARDKKSLDESCESERITESYNEDGFGDLAMLTMEDGGLDLQNYILYHANEPRQKPVVLIKQVVKHLHDLLVNAIIPMNKLNVYHTDIKPSNIVVRTNKTKIQHFKLIDWGLSKINIPDNQRFSFFIHFNFPYESLLFGLSENYSSFSNLNLDIKNIIKEDTEDILSDHIIKDITLLFGTPDTIYTKKMVIDLLTNYLLSIARQCYDEKKGFFDHNILTKNYYCKLDLWGFMICFIDLYKVYGATTNDVIKSYLLNICHYITTYKYDKSGNLDMKWINVWSDKIQELYKIEIKD